MSDEVAAALTRVLALKALPRAGWLRVGIDKPESVAAHSWGVAWLVLTLCPEDLDRGRALAMATVHDLPEVIAGDITPHDGIAPGDKRQREEAALEAVIRNVPRGAEVESLWREYDRGETAEARFVKACDKLDMALQATVYEQRYGVGTDEFVRSALARLGDGAPDLLNGWLRNWLSRPTTT